VANDLRQEHKEMRLTRRGKIVVGIALALAFWGLVEVTAHLWYVGEGGDFLGYCWGSMTECYEGGK
jgi:hypothetical protein